MKYEVTELEDGIQVKEILRRRLGLSTRLQRTMKITGGVTVNDQSQRLNHIVKTGDVVSVSFPQEESHFVAEAIPIETVFEDEDLLIINKQPGIVVHPTKGHPNGTIANGLMMDMKKKGENYKIRFVNRLDMNTSGLLVIAKNAFAQECLVRQMKENQIRKEYLAIVEGFLSEPAGVIDLPIGIEDEHAVGRVVTEKGHASITHFRVERYLKHNRTLLSLQLKTGRTHQIRVHLSHIGYPITGDSLYGEVSPEAISRQALHARFFSFHHPRTGEFITLEAEIPTDMKKLIAD